MFTVSDDRMILIVAMAFFAGAAWGWWLRHMDAEIEDSYVKRASKNPS